jgi:hypothetical protein
MAGSAKGLLASNARLASPIISKVNATMSAILLVNETTARHYFY